MARINNISFILILFSQVKFLFIVSSIIPQTNHKFCTEYTDSTLVGKLTNFDNIIPKPINCPLECITYIQSTSALGYNGPLGALGPLGQFGPALIHPNEQSEIFNMILNYENNPLSSLGPLGDSFWDVMPNINDFTNHMQGLGIWSILGPLGPLGALGPLGPLGPIGIHGLRINENGEYINKIGELQKSITASYNSSVSVDWPLFERYLNKQIIKDLMKKKELDTSFMVLSDAGTYEGDEFIMKVNEPQFISILVTSLVWAKNFFIEVYLNDTFVTKSSTSTSLYTPWVQLYISEKDFVSNLELKVIVKSDVWNCGLMGFLGCSMPYYFYVVGSTNFMLRKPHIKYSGSYINEC